MRKWRGLSCVALLLILVAVTLPQVTNAFFINVGWQEYTHALLDARASLHAGTNFQYEFIDSAGSACRGAQTWTENALDISDSVRTRIALAKIALCNGEDQAALDWIKPIVNNVLMRTQDYSLVMYILSRWGSPNEAIDYYMAIPSEYNQADQNNAVALAFLRQSKALIENGSIQTAEKELQLVLKYRPYDLYANFQLHHLFSKGQGDANALVNELRFFPLEAVLPENSGLVPYITDSIPGLVEEGIWDQSTLEIVLSALVWRYPESQVVEDLVYHLRNQFPNENGSSFDFLLGDLNERRGAIAEAIVAYERNITNWNLSSIRRLISLCQIHPNLCSMSLDNLRSSMENILSDRWAAVSDICGKEKDQGVYCSLLDGKYALQDDPAAVLRDDSSNPMERLTIGLNLFQNPSFETWTNRQDPAEWFLSEMNYGPGKGVFTGGRDTATTIVNANSVRMIGFWGVQPYSSIGLSPSDGAEIRKIPLHPNSKYVLAVNYMTDEEQEVGLTLWSEGLPLCHQPNGNPNLSEVVLPNTQGLWIRVDLILCAPASNPSELSGPTIRLWSPGTVWVNGIYLREGTIVQ